MKRTLKILSILTLVFLSFLEPHTAFAELPATENINAWAGHDLEENIKLLYQKHKIEIIKSSAFTADDIRSFIKGAEALPRFFFYEIGKPIRFRRVLKPCLFGSGRDNKNCPSFGPKGAFLIYDLPPVQGEGPVERYDQLTLKEAIDLQRRRSVAHVFLVKIDEKLKWSETRNWRIINGWKNETEPENQDPWGYSRYLGATSSRYDLITFGESFFIRFQDISSAPLDKNRSVQCQEFSKSRYFFKKLAKLDPKWYRPLYPTCPEFERWANIHDLKNIEILAASATPDRPESIYGHLFMRLEYKGKSNGFEPVFQFGAVTSTDVSALDYFFKGLFGGFTSVLDISSYGATQRRILQREQRNMKRFSLNLSPSQRVLVLERIWEMERRHRLPYVFFFNNCASFILDLLGSALDIEFSQRSSFIVTPSDVLDALSSTPNGKYGMLLKKEAEIELSSREVAIQSIKKRRKLLYEMKLDSLLDGLESIDPLKRKKAYPSLYKNIKEKMDASPQFTFQSGLDILYLSVQIEKYFAEIARRSERLTRVKYLEIQQKRAKEILKERRSIFSEKEDPNRYRKLFSKTNHLEEQLNEISFDATENEKKLLYWVDKINDNYAMITELLGDYIVHHQPDFDSFKYLENQKIEANNISKNHDRLSIGPSGKGRIVLGIENEIYLNKQGIRVQGAVIKEKLGEQRRRGLRPDIESVAIDFQTSFPASSDIFNDIEIELTPFRFLSAHQNIGPIQRNFFDSMGWGFDTKIERIPQRGVEASANLSGGLLLPLTHTSDFRSFWVLGVFPEMRLMLGENSRFGLLGGGLWSRFQLHLFDRYANILELSLSSKHFVDSVEANYIYKHDMRLNLQLLPFFSDEEPAFLRPFFSTSFTNMYFKKNKSLESQVEYRVGIDFEIPW